MGTRLLQPSEMKKGYDAKLHRKKVSKSRKPHRLPPSQRIQTDDIIDLVKGIALSIAAAGVSISAIKKLGNALSSQRLSQNLEDLKSDALTQLKKSLKVVQIAVRRSKTTFHGKSRKKYGPYGRPPSRFKMTMGGEEDEDY